MRRIPIGISDFKKLIEEDYYYVDKTLLIEELIVVGGEVTLLPRPRRFGKTLNLSMLKYFFESTVITNEHLFYNTSIWQNLKYRNYQGKYPVIFLTFKGIEAQNWEKAYEFLTLVIVKEFARYAEFLLPQLPDYERKDYEAILYRAGSSTDFGQSLLFLSNLLERYYKQRVVILIDEYDAPIHKAYAHGYYKELVSFMRELLTAVLKDNPSLDRGIVTGILRIAKEGIFSGLNNLNVFTLLDKNFCDKFGFTPQEVYALLEEQELIGEEEAIKSWYNGYHANGAILYNPWSVLECAKTRGILKAYWVNTQLSPEGYGGQASDNYLVKRLIAHATQEIKIELECLLEGVPIIKEIDEKLVFPNLDHSSTAVWSLLLWTGYVTYSFHEVKEGKDICTLILPNKEIKLLYQSLIQEIFAQSLPASHVPVLIDSFSTANIDRIAELLQEFVLNSVSVFDIPATEPERSYHLFVLGLLVTLGNLYEVCSNKESGYGRYDIMLIPKGLALPGYIIEFKKVSSIGQETLAGAADKALEQIREKNYVQELKKRKVRHVYALGIAFKGKQLLLKAQTLS